MSATAVDKPTMSSLAGVANQGDTDSKASNAPLLSKNTQESSPQVQPSESGDTSKPRKRDFWKLGKKEEDKSKGKEKATTSSHRSSVPQIPQVAGLRPNSPLRNTGTAAGSVSPPRHMPSSPGMVPSPRPHSPASSMIFERNVQEEIVPSEVSPHFATHVMTEDHIPPALDASADAITNSKLDPDAVEIITHAQHQPASVTITGAEQSIASSMHEDQSQSQLPLSPIAHLQRNDGDNTSTYGSLDSTDVRRLSFISFADVVHAEHEQLPSDQRRDSAHLSGHPSLSMPRSPSPIRSPGSTAFGTSPPTSVSTSGGKGAMEVSPNRGGAVPRIGSPLQQLSSSPSQGGGGELNIETMRQVLRHTGSGDLRTPVSAMGGEESSVVEKGLK